MRLKPSKLTPSSNSGQLTLRFSAIGTEWTIELSADGGEFEAIEQAIKQRINKFDATYSRFKTDSWISQLRDTTGTFGLPADAPKMLAVYDKLYESTNGAFTPLIGSVLEQAGYDSAYSMHVGVLSSPSAWPVIVSHNEHTITTTEPVVLDFGGAGKGYLLDLIAEVLQEFSIDCYCLDASGDLLIQTPAPLKIGLEHPDDATKVIGTVTIGNGSLCASATNRRTWQGMHHIINPYSLEPVAGIKAVWAYADSGLVADALATALFFEPPETFLPDFTFSYAILRSDDTLEYAEGFPGELF